MFGSSSVRTIQTVLAAKDRASGKLDDVEAAGDRASESMERTEQRISGVTQAMSVAGGATVALGGSIALLTKRFGRLDKQFQTIKTTSGATAEQMEQVRSAAKGVSTELPVSLAQSTEAAKQLSFAGLSASESMAALSETSQLAVAGNIQAGQAAQTVARSLNAFQLEAEQAGAVVGSLGATFASSATDIQSLAQGLTEVQATANAAGLSVAETVGSLGLLASSGLAGSKAGTSLNAVLRRLTSGSGKASKALEELGLSMQDFTDEEGNLRDLPTIMSTLSEEMEGVDSQAEKIRIAQQLAGSEGARALLPLINQTDELSQKINSNLRAEIQGAIGDLSEMDSSELETASQALGMDVSGETTTKQFISNLQQLNEQGESTEEIVSRLQVGLGLTGDAAELLAQDIAKTDKSAEELAQGIGGVVTAEELAQKQTETLSGQVTQLRSDLQVLGYEMYQGTRPATEAVVSGLRAISTPLAQNETAARALGGGLVALTAATGLATVTLGAHLAQLKLATIAQQGYASSTYAGTAALKAKALATGAATRAQWLMTASTGTLISATTAKTAAMWGSVTSLWASVTASVASASAMGLLSGAAGLAAAGVTALWTALGPIGWLVLGLTAGIAGLAAVMKFDLFGAGDKAGSVLGWFSEKAGEAWAVTKQLLGIFYELGRIGLIFSGMTLLAPFAILLKLPGFIDKVGPKAKQAASNIPPMIVEGLNRLGPAKYALPVIGPLLGIYDLITGFGPEVMQAASQLPPMIVEGLDRLGPAKYALPILGPLLLAKDIVTDPGRWISAGKQIPSMIASGIAQTAGQPVDAVTGMVSDTRKLLPFSPAEKGPLQTLDQTGPALVSTIAEGVEGERGQLTSALEATFRATPLGMAVGAVSNAIGGSQSGSRSRRQSGGGKKYDVRITNNITLEGDASGSTEASVEQAAETGTATALEEFFERLARET